MVAALFGVSGTGKTTTARKIIEKLPDASMVLSITTRSKKDSDIQGEYMYVWRWQFWLLEKLGFFAWVANHHENRYGTLKWSLKKALRRGDYLSIIILNKKAEDLLEYALGLNYQEQVTLIYILSPPENIQRERLKNRGDSDFEIAKRVRDGRKWDQEARESKIPYKFIRNEGLPEETAQEVIDFLGEINKEYNSV